MGLLKISKSNSGTTLVELAIAMVIASIVAIGFTSTLMYTRLMYADTQTHSILSQDAFVIDRYVRNKLTLQLSDSMTIYVDEAAEDAGSPSSSGTILRSVQPDSTVNHLYVENSDLVWTVDATQHNPVDSEVSQLNFTRRTGNTKEILDIFMQLVANQEDTLEIEWQITLRN